VVFGATPEELLVRLDEVFSRLAKAGLKLKPRKYKLFAREIEYLGHIVSAAGVAVNPAKVEAVKNWPTPRCVTDVRAFLGLASYYRRFVKGFATITSPLTRLTDVGASWQWTDVHQQAFDRLKDVLATAPVLAFPVPEAEYVLDTDASLTAVGAVLSQIVNGQEYVILKMRFNEAQEQIVELSEALQKLKLLRLIAHHGRASHLNRTRHASRRVLLRPMPPAESSVTPSRDIDTCTPSDLFPELCLQ
jgi:hypothetical protein